MNVFCLVMLWRYLEDDGEGISDVDCEATHVYIKARDGKIGNGLYSYGSFMDKVGSRSW